MAKAQPAQLCVYLQNDCCQAIASQNQRFDTAKLVVGVITLPPHRCHFAMFNRPCACLACLLLLLWSTSWGVDAWRDGRATFYGNEPWDWSIHHGSCGNGYIWPDQGLGWDIVALADTFPDYAGSCGRCYEVKCKGGSIKDGYGQNINRDGVCRDEGASVVVRTTDTCPCNFPANYYSNKRWCCGDEEHLDLSVFAFQKLTDMKYGVIPVQYRQVDCGQQPDKRACCADFPGEFPPLSQAKSHGNFDYYKYFPNGGYLNSKAGDGSDKVSVDTYLQKAGAGSSSSSSSSSASSSGSGSGSSSVGGSGGSSSGSGSNGGGGSGSSSSGSGSNGGFSYSGWGNLWGGIFGFSG